MPRSKQKQSGQRRKLNTVLDGVKYLISKLRSWADGMGSGNRSKGRLFRRQMTFEPPEPPGPADTQNLS